MDSIDQILDGLEQALVLERELGVRTVEIDRGLLATEVAPAVNIEVSKPIEAPPPMPEPQPAEPIAPPPLPAEEFDYIFIHDRPLSALGAEMMRKIIVKLGKTLETAPIVTDKPIPRAKVFVFLGKAALSKFMPNQRCALNRWATSPKGKQYLLVLSPEDVVRYKVVTPAVDAMKRAMWIAIKSIRQHL